MCIRESYDAVYRNFYNRIAYVSELYTIDAAVDKFTIYLPQDNAQEVYELSLIHISCSPAPARSGSRTSALSTRMTTTRCCTMSVWTSTQEMCIRDSR